MKKLLPVLCALLTLASCGSLRQAQAERDQEALGQADGEVILSLSKNGLSKNGPSTFRQDQGDKGDRVSLSSPDLTRSPSPSLILATAQTYLGTRYRYGGSSAEGMDCSGLVCTAFAAQNILLPRRSADIAALGTELAPEEIAPGDLLFFHTTSRNRITHVGLVLTHEEGEISFIHSSTSSGVIISKLSEPYWKRNFVKAKRVL